MGHHDMAHIAHRITCNRVLSGMKAPDNYKIIKYKGFLSPRPQCLEDLFGIRYYSTISYKIFTKMILINFSFCLSTIHFLEFRAHCKNLYPNKVASGSTFFLLEKFKIPVFMFILREITLPGKISALRINKTVLQK